MMSGREDLEPNMGSKPHCGPGILQFLKYFARGEGRERHVERSALDPITSRDMHVNFYVYMSARFGADSIPPFYKGKNMLT
jgi:hypothetical protein